jgi:HEPN domain-containing protein
MTPGIDKEAEILLVKAAEDESAARLPGMPEGPSGFHAQQAVEKLLKALLCQRSVKYKRTHDLDYLVTLLRDCDENLPATPLLLSQLNDFAVVYRYDALLQSAVPDRAELIETVRIIREHVVARIAALSTTP